MTAAPESNASEVLDAALALADRGIPVFPCKASTDKAENKRPLTSHGFKDASRDPEQIRDDLPPVWRTPGQARYGPSGGERWQASDGRSQTSSKRRRSGW